MDSKPRPAGLHPAGRLSGLPAGLAAALAIGVLAASTAACGPSMPSPSPSPFPSPASTPSAAPVPSGPITFQGPSDTSRVAWDFRAGGAIYGGATVSGESVYFGSDDGFVYALDTVSHRLRWKLRTGGPVRSTPSVAGGLVYVASDDGFVYAIRGLDGRQAWRSFVGDNVKRVSPDSGGAIWDFHESSPVAAGDSVYVGSADGHLYALDSGTGNVRWRFQTPGMVRSTPLVAGGTIYFGSWVEDTLWGSTTYALDAATGELRWSFAGAGDHPTPRLVNGLLYVGGRQGMLYALDAATAQPVWKADFQTSWVESSPAYESGTIFVGSSALGLVQAFDAADGKVRWRFAPSGFPWSSPAVADGVVYIGSADFDGNDEVSLWAIDAASGKGLWRVTAAGPSIDTSTSKLCGFVAGPTVADGLVYIGALDGRLYAIHAARTG